MAVGRLEERFSAYVESLAVSLGHADRKEPFDAYCRGLILPGERKSVEPMAARVRPLAVSAAHQSLHHLVAKAAWSDAALLAAVREQVLPALGPIAAWIIDDTGFPKKGKHSVGVARQYCGQLGKQDNCQVAVSLSVANEQASLPIAYRLYLPQEWADGSGAPAQGRRAGRRSASQTKPQIALEQIRDALAQGVPPGVVLADAGYGADMGFQAGLHGAGPAYVVGHPAAQPRSGHRERHPCRAKPWAGKGRPPKLLRRAAGHRAGRAPRTGMALPAAAWQEVAWREGTKGELVSRFAAVRVRPGHRDYWRERPWPELWLLSSGRGASPSRPSTGSPTSPPTRRSSGSSPSPSCAGGSSATTRSSSRSSASATSRAAAGGAFTTTPALCIAAYGFLVRERATLPPTSVPTARTRDTFLTRDLSAARLPSRARQRHVPTSIATLRHRLAVLLARQLDHCPCCGRWRTEP